jgi:hypothetical protein
MVIESKELFLLVFVDVEVLFKLCWVATFSDVSRSTIITMTINRHERLNMDLVFSVKDLVGVVNAIAIVTHLLMFLNINKNLVWKTDVDECVHSTSEALKHLCFSYSVWVVGQNETFLCCF